MQPSARPPCPTVIVALLWFGLMIGCAQATGGPAAATPAAPAKTLSGRVTYLQRIALPAGAVVAVRLDDVSLADTAATNLATATITTQGENVPIAFTLTYDPAEIRDNHSYAVSARITIDGKLSWISTTRNSVLTAGHPSDDVTITVQPSNPPASS